MDSLVVMKENWLTKKPRYEGFALVFVLCAVIIALSLSDWFSWVPLDFKASPDSIFIQHQYYRLWTSLFVHGDSGHLVSNLILFIPLMYLLSSYFSTWFIPFFAILTGGLINLIVLSSLPHQVVLIGISGVVNWLGAVWMLLFVLIDRRESVRRRFAIILFITLMLFVPDTYKPEISYYSHFLGYIFGLFFAAIYFFINRSNFKQAEVFEVIEEDNILLNVNEIPVNSIIRS
jgi:rhomboid protease GluP